MQGAGGAMTNNKHQQPAFGGALSGNPGLIGVGHVESNLTIRVFLRVLNSDEVEDIAPSKLTKEQLQALFKELLEKTPIIGAAGGNEAHGADLKNLINYDGKDQCYIDVSYFSISGYFKIKQRETLK